MNSNNEEAPYFIVRFFEKDNRLYFNVWWQCLFPDYIFVDSAYLKTNLNLMYFNRDEYSKIIFIKHDSCFGLDFPDINYIVKNNMIFEERKLDSIEVLNGKKVEEIRHFKFYTYSINENEFVRVQNIFPKHIKQKRLVVKEVDSLSVILE